MQMPQIAYEKIEGILPTPSYMQILTSNEIIIIFEIEHILHTPKQYQWLSDIKIIWKRNIIVDFEYISEFWINEFTEATGIKYSLQELSDTFKSEFIKYPKPMYPSNRKELYKRLVWYAMRLNKKELLTIEIMYAVAMRMNGKLEDKYQERELFKKVYQAYAFTRENQQIKTKDEIMQIKKQNGVKRGVQITKEFQERMQEVKRLMPLHVKPNGEPNKTVIARELNLSRVTITKIFKSLVIILLVFWIKSSLIVLGNEIVADSTIIPSATFTLFSKPLFKGFKRGAILQKYRL